MREGEGRKERFFGRNKGFLLECFMCFCCWRWGVVLVVILEIICNWCIYILLFWFKFFLNFRKFFFEENLFFFIDLKLVIFVFFSIELFLIINVWYLKLFKYKYFYIKRCGMWGVGCGDGSIEFFFV